MRADARAKRHDIIQAATRLFAAHGPEVSLRQVAQTAGVGIGTLYRHFPEREDLLLGIVEETSEKILDLTSQALEGWERAPQETWTRFVRSYGDLRVGALVLATGLLDELTTGRFAEITARRELLLQRLTPVLHKAQSAGLVDTRVTPIQFFVGMGAITRPLPAPVETVVSPEAMQHWMVEIYLRGLRPE